MWQVKSAVGGRFTGSPLTVSVLDVGVDAPSSSVTVNVTVYVPPAREHMDGTAGVGRGAVAECPGP